MPLTRIDIPAGKTDTYKTTLRDVVYETLHTVMGVPADDRFEVLNEHSPASLHISPDYLGIQRSGDAIVVQITLNSGRDVAMKRAFYAALAAALETRLGLRPEDLVISLLEVEKEDWSFGNGLATYAES